MEGELLLSIDGIQVEVDWEENESVAALRELVAFNPLPIQMSMYGGFEQVGPLESSLPRQDLQTHTNYGDIVLYSGNQIVIFHGSNSWAYTRLGHIRDLSQAALKEMLGQHDVTITLTRISGLPSHNGENDGEIVAVITSGADGTAETPLLTWGEYQIVETRVPDDYLDDGDSVTVRIPSEVKLENPKTDETPDPVN